MPDSLAINILIFVVSAVVVAFVGTRMSKVADRLADKTGLGEAIMGAVFLGGTTSLSGIVTSVTAAAGGHAELAVSNAVGGIAAQTAFLAVADLFYKESNLEHAAASIANLVQGTLLLSLLSIPILAFAGPPLSFWGVHPATLVLMAAYFAGLRLVSLSQTENMWQPRQTNETAVDKPDDAVQSRSLRKMWLQFLGYAVTIAIAGYFIAQSGVVIAAKTGLTESVVGTLLTAVSTSLPELVTTVAAVRQGALTLAVGGIIGGNCFDLMLIAFSDLAYRDGSIYEAITYRQVFLMALTGLMTGILLLGLLKRERHGIGNIGFESFLILILYVGGVASLFFKSR